jgi:hypothetical protein
MGQLRSAGAGEAVVTALTGMRGVGKTQVAAARARWCIDAGWRLVAWVSARDEAEAVAGLAVVAAQLGIGTAGESLEVAAGRLRHHLEGDEALGLLAEGTLLTFSGDDSVTAHRLVARVTGERCAGEGALAGLGSRLCGLLAELAGSADDYWRDREAARDMISQVNVLHEHLAASSAGGDPGLAAQLLGCASGRWSA